MSCKFTKYFIILNCVFEHFSLKPIIQFDTSVYMSYFCFAVNQRDSLPFTVKRNPAARKLQQRCNNIAQLPLHFRILLVVDVGKDGTFCELVNNK